MIRVRLTRWWRRRPPRCYFCGALAVITMRSGDGVWRRTIKVCNDDVTAGHSILMRWLGR